LVYTSNIINVSISSLSSLEIAELKVEDMFWV